MTPDSSDAGGFQSTLPVWGATRLPAVAGGAIRISIHAPRVGSDALDALQFTRIFKFQSTLPVWGATVRGLAAARSGRISIHAPRVGSDHNRVRPVSPELLISIHAPRVGSDLQLQALDGLSRISIHAPRVGSDSGMGNSAPGSPISIHAPRVGSDSKTAQILLEILSHLNSFAPSEKKKIPFHRKEQGKFIEIF